MTTAGVLTLGVLPGVAIAITLALVIVLIKIYKPDDTILGRVPGLDGFNDIELSPESSTIPGVVIWRFEGPLVFFNAEYFKVRMREIIRQTDLPPRWFVLSLESISQTDATGIKALEELLTEMEAQDIHLILARPKAYMRKLRDNTELGMRLTAQNIYPTIAAAIDAIILRETSPNQKLPRPTGSYQSFYQQRDSDQQHSIDPSNSLSP
jgi:MFS superfamily sulfate permease-like transporter